MDQGTRSLIKRHNEYVREQVVRDLDALETKLNVKRQASNMAHSAVDKAKGTLGMKQDGQSKDAASVAKANAVPLALVGVGGALLARNLSHVLGGNSTTRRTGVEYVPATYETGRTPMYDTSGESSGGLKDTLSSKVGDAKAALSDAGSKLSDKASGVKDTVGSKVDSAKGTASDTGGSMADRASGAKDTMVNAVPSRGEVVTMAKDHAPVLGAAAMAAGLIAGALAPRTRMEEEKLAPLQHQVVDRATDMAETNLDRAKGAAKGALEAGKEAVSEEYASSDSSDDPEPATSRITTPNRITGLDGTTDTVTNGIGGSSASRL